MTNASMKAILVALYVAGVSLTAASPVADFPSSIAGFDVFDSLCSMSRSLTYSGGIILIAMI